MMWFPGAGLVARLRSAWRDIRRRDAIEDEMMEEFRHHLELRTEDLIRRGVPPGDATRQARLEFGHIEGHREDARASRGLRYFDELRFSSLDVKLGLRMLTKHPGLSLVSVIGMSVAIAIGAAGFGFLGAVVDTRLPLEAGDRLVVIRSIDARDGGSSERQSLQDFLHWRGELRTVRDLSAFVTSARALSTPGEGEWLVDVAHMTASGFHAARVAPMLGRPLQDADERAGARVVVIAHDEWQHRFAGDPEIIGRTVRLDTAMHTIVGVMPEGFRFPLNHRYWAPLPLDVAAGEARSRRVHIFGRLADGATLEQARAELATMGASMANASDTHQYLRPRVLPYTHAFIGIDNPAMARLLRAGQLALSLLLVVVSVNVAILIYARTAARTGEITVRTALGASRRRVVAQLFAEALVLSLAAAALGLTIAALGFEWFHRFFTGGIALPFWFDPGLSPAVVAYTSVLAVLAAVIVGVVPALGATGPRLQAGLQQLSSHGSQLRLGRTWTALIVVQVAVAVAVLPYALYTSGRFAANGFATPDYPVDELMRASIRIAGDGAHAGDSSSADVGAARFVGSVSELIRRLDAEPTVASVTFASHFPGDEELERIEVEGTGTRPWVWANRVDPALFSVFDVPMLSGRVFEESDTAPGSNVAIVDRTFAEEVLGGGNVLGRRVRHVRTPSGGAPAEVVAGPWLEVVGVVPAFTVPPAFEPVAPKIYRPLALADAPGSIQLAIRLGREADPATFLARVREMMHAVDPALRFVDLQTATDAERGRRHLLLSMVLLIIAITGSVLLLSAAGIYAMMSFIVTSRRRELGIRAALGAGPRRLLRDIFARASRQLGAGLLGGLLLAEAVAWALGGRSLIRLGMLLPLVAVVITAIGLLASLGPALRGLRIEPTEALREE